MQKQKNGKSKGAIELTEEFDARALARLISAFERDDRSADDDNNNMHEHADLYTSSMKI